MKYKKECVLAWLLVLSLSITAQQKKNHPPTATAAEATAAFRDLSKLKDPYMTSKPIHRNDGVPIGELGVDSGDKAMLLELGKELGDHKHGVYDSFLIAHKDKLLFELYAIRGRIDLPHPQASATKAYTSLALGRAIQLGYLTMEDLDKPLVTFLKDLEPSKFVDGVETITLHKALTMRGGLRVNKEEWEELEKTPKLIAGQRQVQQLFQHTAPITPESQEFDYGNYNPVLVMQVIEAVVPGTAKAFLKNEVLDKLGIENYNWQTALSGLPEAGWRTSITSRDMLKIGIMTMNDGRWNGEQLVPKAYIDRATSPILYNGDDDIFGGGKDVSKQGYGYFWWNAQLKHGNKNYYSTSAQGGGGQYVILIKELDLIVVATSHNNDNKTLQIVAEQIIPAFTK